MKTGTRNVTAEREAIEAIESIIRQFKKRRMTRDEFVRRVNQNLSKMADERDYIQYLQNIGQY